MIGERIVEPAGWSFVGTNQPAYQHWPEGVPVAVRPRTGLPGAPRVVGWSESPALDVLVPTWARVFAIAVIGRDRGEVLSRNGTVLGVLELLTAAHAGWTLEHVAVAWAMSPEVVLTRLARHLWAGP